MASGCVVRLELGDNGLEKLTVVSNNTIRRRVVWQGSLRRDAGKQARCETKVGTHRVKGMSKYNTAGTSQGLSSHLVVQAVPRSACHARLPRTRLEKITMEKGFVSC